VQQAISGETPLFALLGRPVARSLSPLLHNTMFALSGRPGVYVALEVGAGAAALGAALRALPIRGLNLTLPLKQTMLDQLDGVGPCAAAAGAVNTVLRALDGRLIGYNTDGDGLVAAVEERRPLPSSAVVLGAGGAARGVAAALHRRGLQVWLQARRAEAAEAAAAAIGCSARPWCTGAPSPLVIDCTAAPEGEQAGLLRLAPVENGGLYVDTNYWRKPEPALRAALQAAGAVPLGGHAMLLHQARLSFAHFTGAPAPTAAALRAALPADRWPEGA
jgi:shikimate dehydrogenase